MEAEAELLRARGHSVSVYSANNATITTMGKARLVANTVWSTSSASEIKRQAHESRATIFHVHNTFPLISPSVYWVAESIGVPVVQTLHNFRLLCPQAMFLRNGGVCEDCLGKAPWRGAVHGCYRESKAQSAVLASMLGVHRMIGTWQRKVTRYIALNEFCKAKFIEGGLPANKLRVKPNFVDVPALPDGLQRAGLLFVGRLSVEKGVVALAQASLSIPSGSLCVVGSGPDSAELAASPGTRMLGHQHAAGVNSAMRIALALVVPSIWYENFPRTIVEAFGNGLPVIASRIGALAEIVEDGVTGLLFPAGDAQALAERMNWALAHPHEMQAMGQNARARYEALYSPEVNYRQLMGIYREAIEARQQMG